MLFSGPARRCPALFLVLLTRCGRTEYLEPTSSDTAATVGSPTGVATDTSARPNDSALDDATAPNPSPQTDPESSSGSSDGIAPAPPSAPGPEPDPSIDPNELPGEVPTVKLEISSEAQSTLDADPWDAPDVLGTFIDHDGTRYENIELNYRGAYALQNVINSGGKERNWKVKFTSDAPYLGRREWNFNKESHLREKLAYDLMKFAGVRVPSAEHVELEVNGEHFGFYLRYEDPDNKSWLKDMFGSAAGDLYKAATDLPDQKKYFALLTELGETDEDYLLHYNKKLNNEGAAETDYRQLRSFVHGLNATADAELGVWFEARFDTTKFIDYLVVSNFISNWDSYPQRPKNYWLYQSPVTQRWIYIPWDMDATFQSDSNSLHPMGDRASIFHEFDAFEGNDPNTEEGSERPLVRRLMALPEYRAAYLERYRQLRAELLNPDFIENRAAKLIEVMARSAAEDDVRKVREDTERVLQFVRIKTESVDEQLQAE